MDITRLNTELAARGLEMGNRYWQLVLEGRVLDLSIYPGTMSQFLATHPTVEFRDPSDDQIFSFQREPELKYYGRTGFTNPDSSMDSEEIGIAKKFGSRYQNRVLQAVLSRELNPNQYIFDILTNPLKNKGDLQFLGSTNTELGLMLNYQLDSLFNQFTVEKYFIEHEAEHLKSDPIVRRNLPKSLSTPEMRGLVYEIVNDLNNVIKNEISYLQALRNANNGYFAYKWGPYFDPVILKGDQMLKVVFQYQLMKNYKIEDNKFTALYDASL